MSHLDGQVGFVTGTGRGIGQDVAFALEGAIVGVADMDKSTAEAAVSGIAKNSGKARAFPINVSRRDDVLRAVPAILQIEDAITVFGGA